MKPESGPTDSPWVVTTGEQAPHTVHRLLGELPGWFGIESANAGYVAAARELPTYLAWPSGIGPASTSLGAGQAGGQEPAQPVGVLLAARHFPGAAEIYLLAVEPSLHRRGVGRALVEAVERDLVANGVRLLQVKTLGPAHPDPGYARTRSFYEGMGFDPLEELADLWPDNPCLIMVKVLAPDRQRRTSATDPDGAGPEVPYGR